MRAARAGRDGRRRRAARAGVRRLFAERAGQIAALIVEPLVQCAAGMAMHDPSYVRGLRALCDEFGVHLIADEIAVGAAAPAPSSRASRPACGPISCACRRDQRRLSAVVAGAHARRRLRRSTTTTRRAASCIRIRTPATRSRAARRRHARAVRARRRARRQRAQVGRAARRSRRSTRIRRCATCASAARCSRSTSRSTATRRAASRAASSSALERELLLRPIGTTVYLMPPYVMTDDDIAWLAQRTRDTLDATLAEAAR
jgi:adenosylmethionine-8-amino-7-oxononanoate aminotransferase